MMRQAGSEAHADRVRALTESDLNPKGGSVLIRSGKERKHRPVGMNDWAWEHVTPWTEGRARGCRRRSRAEASSAPFGTSGFSDAGKLPVPDVEQRVRTTNKDGFTERAAARLAAVGCLGGPARVCRAGIRNLQLALPATHPSLSDDDL